MIRQIGVRGGGGHLTVRAHRLQTGDRHRLYDPLRVPIKSNVMLPALILQGVEIHPRIEIGGIERQSFLLPVPDSVLAFVGNLDFPG